MAVTWTASAPHATAVKEVQKAGLGSGYGTSNSAVCQPIKWPGNKRAVLTKLTASGTYTTGGDALTPSDYGLREIHAAFVVASPTVNVKPVVIAATASGQPTVLCTTPTAPTVQYFNASAEATNGTTITNDTFHVLLVGI